MAQVIKVQMCVQLKEGEKLEQFVPKKAHSTDAGYDIYAAGYKETTISPGTTALIPAGFKISVPAGYEAQIRPRSGCALKQKLMVANSPGTIDCGYLGEVGIIVYNGGQEALTIKRGDKIAQMVISKLPEVELHFVKELNEESERGDHGFGSTGV